MGEALGADRRDSDWAEKNQSTGAIVNYAQAAMPIGNDVRGAIVNFETSLTTARFFTWSAFSHQRGRDGGPIPRRLTNFHVGIDLSGSMFHDELRILGPRTPRLQRSGGAAASARKSSTTAPSRWSDRSPRSCAVVDNTPNVGGNVLQAVRRLGVASVSRRRRVFLVDTFRDKTTYVHRSRRRIRARRSSTGCGPT